MNRVLSLCLAFALILVSADQSDAKMYKWKDENGKWHFTDDASKMPPNPSSSLRQAPSRQEIRPPIQSDQEKQSRIGKKRPQTSHSPGKSLEQGMEEGFAKMEEGFEKMGEALGKGLAKGMEKLGEELGKVFEGIGELMVIAEQNKPDMEKKVFANKEEEVRHDVKQVLLGMFLVCQFQYIVGKAETCSKDGLKGKLADGWKIDENSEMKKKFEEYVIEIDPGKNTRRNLLIKAHHKKVGGVWEITHEGKKSLKESARQSNNKDSSAG